VFEGVEEAAVVVGHLDDYHVACARVELLILLMLL
jgi:hypothetical protein